MKLIQALFLALIVITTSYAQEPRSKEDRIKAIKIAFITEELALTPEQSKGFWPIYNELQEKLKKQRGGEKGRPDFDAMSDAELETWLNNHLKAEEERVALSRIYVEKFKKVITVRQIVKLKKAEHDFKRQLLEHSKERRKGH